MASGNNLQHDEIADGNFQLRAEDVEILTRDLKKALIPFDHLHFIGTIGEGIIFSV